MDTVVVRRPLSGRWREILIALSIYRLSVWLFNRAFGTRLPLMSVFIERTAGPAQLALCLLPAVALVLPLAPLDDAFRTGR